MSTFPLQPRLAPPPAAARRGVPGPTWWRAARVDPELAGLRGDARDNALKVAWALALATRPDGTTSPTWARLAESTGLSRATVARWLRWWHQRGRLVTDVHGSTAQFRGRLSPLRGNIAAVYRLVRPATETPLCLSRSERPPRARETSAGPVTTRAHAPQERRTTTAPWPTRQAATNRRERAAAAATLMTLVPALRHGRAGAVRHATSALLRRGWTIADLLRALDVRPDGSRWTHTHDVRSPHGWLRHRLAAWDGHAGPASTAADAAQRERNAAAAARSEREAAARASVPAPAWFTDLRLQLARARGRRT